MFNIIMPQIILIVYLPYILYFMHLFCKFLIIQLSILGNQPPYIFKGAILTLCVILLKLMMASLRNNRTKKKKKMDLSQYSLFFYRYHHGSQSPTIIAFSSDTSALPPLPPYSMLLDISNSPLSIPCAIYSAILMALTHIPRSVVISSSTIRETYMRSHKQLKLVKLSLLSCPNPLIEHMTITALS